MRPTPSTLFKGVRGDSLLCQFSSHPPVKALLGGSPDTSKPFSAHGLLVGIRRDTVPVVCKTWLEICRNTPGLWHSVAVDGGATLERHGLPLIWARALPWLLARTQMRTLTIRCRPIFTSEPFATYLSQTAVIISARKHNNTGWSHKLKCTVLVVDPGGRLSSVQSCASSGCK